MVPVPASWERSQSSSAEDDLHGGFESGAIGLVKSAEGFTHEALVEADGVYARLWEAFSGDGRGQGQGYTAEEADAALAH